MSPFDDTISRILFDIDPMGTCCKENSVTDEYDAVAIEIADYVNSGFTLTYAIRTVFEEVFDEYLDDDTVVRILTKMKECENEIAR